MPFASDQWEVNTINLLGARDSGVDCVYPTHNFNVQDNRILITVLCKHAKAFT